MSKPQTFTVGVFRHPGAKKMKYMAYTTWYNSQWEGCTEVEVEATSGSEAKKKAIGIVRKMDEESV